jgi:hypothetical protein
MFESLSLSSPNLDDIVDDFQTDGQSPKDQHNHRLLIPKNMSNLLHPYPSDARVLNHPRRLNIQLLR